MHKCIYLVRDGFTLKETHLSKDSQIKQKIARRNIRIELLIDMIIGSSVSANFQCAFWKIAPNLLHVIQNH